MNAKTVKAAMIARHSSCRLSTMITNRKKGRSHNEVNLIEMAAMSVNSPSTASVNERHERKSRPSSIEVSLSAVETSENRLGVAYS
jgi:hypothetical protein